MPISHGKRCQHLKMSSSIHDVSQSISRGHSKCASDIDVFRMGFLSLLIVNIIS